MLKLTPLFRMFCLLIVTTSVPSDSSSRGGDVAVNVFDINQPSVPTPYYSVLVSVSVLMTLSALFHSINSLDKTLRFLTLFFHCCFCPTSPFNYIYLFMKVSFQL